jgi:hypothetical protein
MLKMTMILSILIFSISNIYSEIDVTPEKKLNLRTKVASSCKITDYVLAVQNECMAYFKTLNEIRLLNNIHVYIKIGGFESIHGLWPDPESSCTDCTNEQFSESQLSTTTLNNMKKYWPTCESGTTNDSFWSHEWSKHGTCNYFFFL